MSLLDFDEGVGLFDQHDPAVVRSPERGFVNVIDYEGLLSSEASAVAAPDPVYEPDTTFDTWSDADLASAVSNGAELAFWEAWSLSEVQQPSTVVCPPSQLAPLVERPFSWNAESIPTGSDIPVVTDLPAGLAYNGAANRSSRDASAPIVSPLITPAFRHGSTQGADIVSGMKLSYNYDQHGAGLMQGHSPVTSHPRPIPTPVDYPVSQPKFESTSSPTYVQQPRTLIPCEWGDDCDIGLDDLSAGGLQRHLREWHFGQTWTPLRTVACQWHDGGQTCGRAMQQRSLGKHVAALHLKAMAVTCGDCGKTFARPDVLRKHQNECCEGYTLK